IPGAYPNRARRERLPDNLFARLCQPRLSAEVEYSGQPRGTGALVGRLGAGTVSYGGGSAARGIDAQLGIAGDNLLGSGLVDRFFRESCLKFAGKLAAGRGSLDAGRAVPHRRHSVVRPGHLGSCASVGGSCAAFGDWVDLFVHQRTFAAFASGSGGSEEKPVCDRRSRTAKRYRRAAEGLRGNAKSVLNLAGVSLNFGSMTLSASPFGAAFLLAALLLIGCLPLAKA